MTRTTTTVMYIDHSGTSYNVTDNDVTVDATLVTNGLDITNFFDTREGTRCLLFTNTSSVATGTITIQAGVGPSAGIGDLVVAVAQNKQVIIGNLDGSRFDQGDGSLYVDFKTGVTGSIAGVAEGGSSR